MRELSVTEQRYKAVLAVIADGKSVTEVAADWRVSRQTVHAWLARYEAGGLEGLGGRLTPAGGESHQMPAVVEAAVLELRRWKPYWGPRSIISELAAPWHVRRCPRSPRCTAACFEPAAIDPRRSKRKVETLEAVGTQRGRWSCGRWTSWVASCWPMDPLRKH